MAKKTLAAVAEPEVDVTAKPDRREKTKPRRQPRYHVILWNDEDHTYAYVVAMMKQLFGHPTEKGYQIAEEVDSQGRAVCMTTTLELAELKRDQIHAYGRDANIPRCAGSMSATIEPQAGSDD